MRASHGPRPRRHLPRQRTTVPLSNSWRAVKSIWLLMRHGQYFSKVSCWIFDQNSFDTPDGADPDFEGRTEMQLLVVKPMRKRGLSAFSLIGAIEFPTAIFSVLKRLYPKYNVSKSGIERSAFHFPLNPTGSFLERFLRGGIPPIR